MYFWLKSACMTIYVIWGFVFFNTIVVAFLENKWIFRGNQNWISRLMQTTNEVLWSQWAGNVNRLSEILSQAPPSPPPPWPFLSLSKPDFHPDSCRSASPHFKDGAGGGGGGGGSIRKHHRRNVCRRTEQEVCWQWPGKVFHTCWGCQEGWPSDTEALWPPQRFNVIVNNRCLAHNSSLCQT